MGRPHGNFAAELQAHWLSRGGDICLTVPDGPSFTYAEIDDWAARIATVLIGSGALRGDRIVVHVDKSAAAVALYLACLRSGLVHVPLNPAFTLDELEYFLDDAQPTVVISPSAASERVGEMAPTARVMTLDPNGSGTLTSAARQAKPSAVATLGDSELAVLVYTSGTTGKPKGSMVTHANLRHNAEALHYTWDFSSDDVLLHCLPIFHVHGLFVALHCAMLAAAPIHLLPRFDLDTVMSLIPQSTVLMGVPTHYSRLMADPRFTADLCSQMRLFTSGSAPLSAAAFESFHERTGHQLCERYGMSEAGIITSNPGRRDSGLGETAPDDSGRRIAGTVGYPLPGYRIRIADQARIPQPAGTEGLVEIAGPHLFDGYWRNEKATYEAHRGEDWFTTGDVGKLSDDGRLTLEGRSGDMIITGGENIHPKEIEAALEQIGGIAESAVVGIPHPDLGEAVVAVVVAAGTFDQPAAEAELNRSLARFKHPRSFQVVNKLPRNDMGKVMKNELRIRFIDLFIGGGSSTDPG